MGVSPSDHVIRELEQEAYSALLRAIYAHPHGATDPLAIDAFLTKAREQLRIDNHSEILESVRNDLELIRQGQRIAPGRSTPLSAGPIGASGPPRGKRASGGFKTPSTGGKTGSRARFSRSQNADPREFVGRRIWRFYPEEDPGHPWVEGFISDYDSQSGMYTILYDPNDPAAKESAETNFNFMTAKSDEYVLGEFVNLAEQSGSRRIAQKPHPVKVPTPSSQGPSKRRRASALKIPSSAPFHHPWFENAILDASAEELNIMLSMLEKREIDIMGAIKEAEKSLALGEELEARVKLETEFEDLCKKEEAIMKQLEQLRQVEQ